MLAKWPLLALAALVLDGSVMFENSRRLDVPVATPETAAVLIQSPNFFGTIEDVAAIAEIAHKNGAMLVVSIPTT